MTRLLPCFTVAAVATATATTTRVTMDDEPAFFAAALARDDAAARWRAEASAAIDACDAALNALLVPHLVVLLLNVLLLCCDIAKYNGNCADAAFAAAASSYKAKAA